MYAVAVCICLLEDWRWAADEEKARRHCGHVRGAEADGANREIVDVVRANALVVRNRDIVVRIKVGVMATCRDRACVT